MAQTKIIIFILVIIAIVGAIFYLESQKPARDKTGASDITRDNGVVSREAAIEEKTKKYELAKEISSPDGFINASEITIQELIGKKVILVDFWTYSCINCQRTLPYLNAWNEKYKDKGLAIIGLHTPEFKFEEKYENVVNAVKKFKVKYPVVLDNDYSTWNAYKNRYWPRKYLIDIDGFIVYDHIGEGAYGETEKKIQELLKERMKVLGGQGGISESIVKPKGAESLNFGRPRSPEIYFGAARNSRLGNGMPGKVGIQMFKEPTSIKSNALYLAGDWNLSGEFAENKTADAKIIFHYQAQKVFFVASSEKGADIKILKDGDLVKTFNVKDSQLYRLIEDEEWGEHTLEIIIRDSGLKAFTFTFG